MKLTINLVTFSAIAALIAYFYDLSFFQVFVVISLSVLLMLGFIILIGIMSLDDVIEDKLLNDDYPPIQAELSEIKSEMLPEIIEKQSEFESSFSCVEYQLSDIESTLSKLKDEVSAVKSEMSRVRLNC